MLAASETAAVMTSKGASDAACISKMDFNILHVWKGRWPGWQEREGERQAGGDGGGRRGSRKRETGRREAAGRQRRDRRQPGEGKRRPFVAPSRHPPGEVTAAVSWLLLLLLLCFTVVF